MIRSALKLRKRLIGTLPPALQSPVEDVVTTKNQIPWKLKDNKGGPQCPPRDARRLHSCPDVPPFLS